MSSSPIVFYDIASGPPNTCFAPNPWKTRYALNFKGAHYQTDWVELPDVTSVRKRLGAAPNRSFPDGSPFYTLPIIKDTSNDEVVGDSFDIALYLDKAYSDGPVLFPPSTVGLQRAFNLQVDAIFTNHCVLCSDGMPLNPATAEASRAAFVERSGLKDWESLNVRGDERARTLEALKTALAELTKVYSHSNGPFLNGNDACYADFIVGAWLQFYKATLPGPEWTDLQTWHGGLWRNIHQALEQFSEVK